jgi:hypothetical protein
MGLASRLMLFVSESILPKTWPPIGMCDSDDDQAFIVDEVHNAIRKIPYPL